MRSIGAATSLALVAVMFLTTTAMAQEDEPESVASSRIVVGSGADAVDLTLNQWRTTYPVYWLTDEDYCTLFASWLVEPGSLADIDTVRCQAQLALVAARDVVQVPEAMIGGMRRVVGLTQGSLRSREMGVVAGSGARTTEPFWLDGGEYRVSAHRGKGKGKGQAVTAVLKDTQGRTHATLADPVAREAGPRQVVTLDAGSYYLVVTGGPARWKVAWEPVE